MMTSENIRRIGYLNAEYAERKIMEKEAQNLPAVVDNGDGTLTIGGKTFKIRDSVYQTADDIRRGCAFEDDSYHVDGKDKNGNQRFLAYLNHVAKEHPILQEVLDGEIIHDDAHNPKRASLEDAVREKGPSTLKHLFQFMMNRNDEKYGFGSYQKAKKEYLARRKGLCKVLGVDEKNFRFNNEGWFYGSLIGLVSSVFSSGSFKGLVGIPWIFGGSALGSIAGSNIQRYATKRKLSSRAAEVDSWIHKARRAQGLEGKVEDVGLSEWEKEKARPRIAQYLAAVGSTLTSYMLFGPDFPLYTTFVAGVTFGMGTYFGLKKLFTNRALKKKRREAGLDEEGMREVKTIEINENKYEDMESMLIGRLGFKKKLLRRKFVGDGIDVKYKPIMNIYSSEAIPVQDGISLTISATSEEKAQPIIEALRSLTSPFQPGEIMSDGTKVPYKIRRGRGKIN
jgi:hypothetical protein